MKLFEDFQKENFERLMEMAVAFFKRLDSLKEGEAFPKKKGRTIKFERYKPYETIRKNT